MAVMPGSPLPAFPELIESNEKSSFAKTRLLKKAKVFLDFWPCHVLPVAQYFFGVWGLILATPVAVYVIHVLILRSGLPGSQWEKT